MDYAKAENIFNTCKNASAGKPIANNTRLLKSDNDYIIRFYQTDIIKINSDNVYTLQNGGYFTPTTKQRINDLTPAKLSQRQKKWFIGNNSFFDGIKIDNAGNVLNPLSDETEKIKAEKRKKLDKMITKYINGFCDHIEKGLLQYPSGGDCWFCGLFHTDSHEHIFNHFEENYFVPSLLFNAIKSKSYKNPALIFEMIKRGNNHKIARSELRYYFRKIYSEMLNEIM